MFRVGGANSRQRIYRSFQRHCSNKQQPSNEKKVLKDSKIPSNESISPPPNSNSGGFGSLIFLTSIVGGGLAYKYKNEIQDYWKLSDQLISESKNHTEETAALSIQEANEAISHTIEEEKEEEEESTSPSSSSTISTTVVPEEEEAIEEIAEKVPIKKFEDQMKQVTKLEAKAPIKKQLTPIDPVVLNDTTTTSSNDHDEMDNTQQQKEEIQEISKKIKRLQTEKMTIDVSTQVSEEVEKEVHTFGEAMEKSLLTDIHSIDASELRVRLIQMVSELKNRTELESFRLADAIRKVEEEASAKNTARIQEQSELHESVLKKKLQMQEEAFNAQTASAIEGLRQKYTTTMTDALQEQKTKLHEEYTENMTTQIRAIETQLQSELSAQVNELKQVHETEREERLKVLEDFRLQLKALNTVLDSRSVYEAFSHQVHKVSVAALALSNCIESSNPLHNELTALHHAGRGDDLIEAVLETIPTTVANQGAPTTAQLFNRFKTVHKLGRQAAMVPKESGMMGHLAGKVLATVTIAPKGPIEGTDAEAIFSRTAHFLEAGDLESAVKEMDTLTDYPAEVANDWIVEAKSRLLLEQAAKVIKAHVSLLAASCT